MGWRFINPKLKAMYGVDTMPQTAENVAEQFNINRADQDQFALAVNNARQQHKPKAILPKKSCLSRSRSVKAIRSSSIPMNIHVHRPL
jgi:acetyl-CoA acetyltransferase